MLTLGDKIKYAREKSELKPQELAAKINISQPYMSQIENNSRKPGRETLIRISKVLNYPLDFFISNDIETFPNEDQLTEITVYTSEGKAMKVNPGKYINHFAILDDATEAGLSEKQIHEAIQFAIKMKTQA